MNNTHLYEIISFYEFKHLGDLERIKSELRSSLIEHSVFGTIIIAEEGYNASLCGESSSIGSFLHRAELIFNTKISYKSSFHTEKPFRKNEVRIKAEIVTLRQTVDISKGAGTHVKPCEWNEIISDPETFVLDARNDYEHLNGTFRDAINLGTKKFSELPRFVAENLDPTKHKRVAMFCTGGIRCEKFAPYLKTLGFEEVFQLEGGILKYIEEIPAEKSLWQGECFVFDERRTVDEKLEKGVGADYSLRHKTP